MANNVSQITSEASFFTPTTSTNHNKCKKITYVTLLVISGILMALGLALIVSGACFNILGMLIAGSFVLLIGTGIILYFCHLTTLKKTSFQLQQSSVPEPPLVSNLRPVLPLEPLLPAAVVIADKQRPEDSHPSQILQPSVALVPGPVDSLPPVAVAIVDRQRPEDNHPSQILQPSVALVPAPVDSLPPVAVAIVDRQRPEDNHPSQILQPSVILVPGPVDSLPPPVAAAANIQPETPSSPGLPLSLFNQVFCNADILELILHHMSEKNRDQDGALVDIVHTIEDVNPPGTSLEVLNNLTQIQELAYAVGFNATTIFKEPLLRESGIHYVEQMALLLKQVFIDLQKTDSFSYILRDISPDSLHQIHFILLLKSLLNWLSLINLIDFTKEVINTENKNTASSYCLFMFNLLKVNYRSSTTRRFYAYGTNIKTNCWDLVRDDAANINKLKQLIKDALRRESLFPVILFLVFLFNEVIDKTLNPQKTFTSEERAEILRIAEQSNSPEKEEIIKMLLKSLKVPI